MTANEKGRPQREGGPGDERLSGGYVEATVSRRVATLPRRDRNRLLARLAELRELEQGMRAPGLLTEVAR